MTERPIVVVEPDVVARRALVSQLPGAVELESADRLESELHGPTVVVFGPGMAGPDRLAEAGPLLSSRPAVGAVLISDQLSTELLKSALRAGFRDVLTAPVDHDELTETIDRIADTLPGISLPAPTPRHDDVERGRMITVFSTKGGAGKSVIATNIAVSLARQTTRPVVLVDADLQFGDVAVMLKLAPRHTIVDAVASLDKLDAGLLRSLLVQHESGLLVLSAPLEPAFADQIDAKQMIEITDMLREMAAYVVVDTPAHFNDISLGLIEESDDVLMVAGLDIPNIKNVRIGLQTLRLLNTPMHKIRLVLNRANSKVKLDVAEVEKTLQVKAESRIPSDVSVPQSVNKGEPIVMDAPRSGPAKALEELVKLLVDAPAQR